MRLSLACPLLPSARNIVSGQLAYLCHCFPPPMGLSLVVEKNAETDDACVYAFGLPAETAGRVRLQKTSGDVEVLSLSDTTTGANPHFLLAHLVPHLHDYHDRGTYPDRDQWSV